MTPSEKLAALFYFAADGMERNLGYCDQGGYLSEWHRGRADAFGEVLAYATKLIESK